MMDEKYAGTTPRTDAFLENALSAIHETETIEDFTRQLERERNGLATAVLRLKAPSEQLRAKARNLRELGRQLAADDCEAHAAALEKLKVAEDGWKRECDDANKLLRGMGLQPEQFRTEGGSLMVAKALDAARRK